MRLKPRTKILLGLAIFLALPIPLLLLLPNIQKGPQFRFIQGLPRSLEQRINTAANRQHVRREYEYKTRTDFKALAKKIEAELLRLGYKQGLNPNPNTASWRLDGPSTGGFRSISMVAISSERSYRSLLSPGSIDESIPADSILIHVIDMQSASPYDKIVTWLDNLGE